MPLQERISDELKSAMKARDSLRVSVLRLLQSSIKNCQIDRGRDYVLTETDFIEVIVSAVKQRKESIEQYSNAGREDLAKKERDELEVLQAFLPAPMGDEELEAKIQAAVASVGATRFNRSITAFILALE